MMTLLIILMFTAAAFAGQVSWRGDGGCVVHSPRPTCWSDVSPIFESDTPAPDSEYVYIDRACALMSNGTAFCAPTTGPLSCPVVTPRSLVFNRVAAASSICGITSPAGALTCLPCAGSPYPVPVLAGSFQT